MTALETIKARIQQSREGERGVTEGEWWFDTYSTIMSPSNDMDNPVARVPTIAGDTSTNEGYRNAAFIASARLELPMWREIAALLVEALKKIAKPALGGKQQQSDAREALESAAALLKP